MGRHQLAWWLWAVGTLLIALSWFGVVNHIVGWGGFAIGMVGSVLGWGLRPPAKAADPDAAQQPPDQVPTDSKP